VPAERLLHFNAFLMSCGHHEAAWRLPESDPSASLDLSYWTNLARIAERGTFDSVFLADGPALWGHARFRPGGALEPTVLLTALAGATSRIGLIATASTSYNHPYNLARRFASLAHVSGGRAGWNIVTTATAAAAQNFGLDDNPAHAERYRRAAEFTDVSIRLWDSWEDGAELGDKAAGVYADLKARVRRLGRDPDQVKILPGLVPAIGSTEAEARALEAELEELIIPEYGLAQLAKVLEIPAERLELDRGLPEEVYARPLVEGAQSRFELVTELARRDNLTVRQLIGRLGGGRGHRTFAGTPEQVADTIVEWAEAGAADGFNVMPPVLPSGLEAFTEHVIPLLRQRGVFRTEYTGRTLARALRDSPAGQRVHLGQAGSPG
jgi:alkanesulfonate monooxygenase SsuD/methylene tetrahydromethanopterin reductase-like flavin-dependent oxidoreductase (luciferase family)